MSSDEVGSTTQSWTMVQGRLLNQGPIQFEFFTDPPLEHEVAVNRFQGVESIHDLYRFDIELCGRAADFGLHTLTDRRATLIIRQGDDIRSIHGVIANVHHHPRGTEVIYTTVTLVPELYWLQQVQSSRIFQDKTVIEIVQEVLAIHGLYEKRLALHFVRQDRYPQRPYRVQYQETALAFISRLLEEEGIFYYFDHDSGQREKLVLCDANQLLPPIARDSRILYRDPQGMVAHERHISSIDALTRSHTTAVTHRGFDYHDPRASHENSRRITETLNREVYSFRHGLHHQSHDEANRLSTIHLQSLSVKRTVLRGQGSIAAFSPGFTFELFDHPITDYNTAYVLWSVQHQGTASTQTTQPNTPSSLSYATYFECIPRATPIRANALEKKKLFGPQCARVVGPGNEEIYVDSMGRIKVEFFWDRRDQHNDHASCWVRVAQSWASDGWGSMVIPRVGMEVIVSFIDGDPDQPIVTGCVFNGNNNPPMALPGQKARSIFRSHSTPAGRGYSEVVVDDTIGSEFVALRSEKDCRALVQHDYNLVVGNDQTTSIGVDQKYTVNSNRQTNIGGNDSLKVGKNLSIEVTGTCHTQITGDQVTLTRQDTIINAEGEYVQKVKGAYALIVGQHDQQQPYQLHVEGATTMSSSNVYEISSQKEVIVRCGKSSLRLSPERVEIEAPDIVLKTQDTQISLKPDTLRFFAKEDIVAKANRVLLKSSTASVGLTSVAKIDGQKILLASPTPLPDDIQDPPRQIARIELVDPEGRPLPNQRYIVQLSDGTERSGVLDKHGCAEIELEETATVVFPDLGVTQTV